MKVFILLALLGSALALQAPVEYVYHYQARVATGIQSARPQYAGTGLRAIVRVTMEQEGVGLIEVSDVKVGEHNQVVGNNGRDEMAIDYKPIHDKALELPFKAHFMKHDGETVLEVPQSDLLWVTNIRRGIASFFRTAPIVDPSSVSASPSGQHSEVEPQAFSRIEDTYAGRCRVGYTVTPASVYDVPHGPNEDIQSQDARKGPGGCAIKIAPHQYRVQSAIDFSSCSDRVSLQQTGAGNLTNITSSTYRDVASRTHVSQYIIQGSPGKFRIQSGVIESVFIMNPFGIETDKVVIVSNQTMQLDGARTVPGGVQRPTPQLRAEQTWRQQVQSPNAKPQGYSPRWIQYKQEQSEQPYSPIYYERLVSGFKLTDASQDSIKGRIHEALKKASDRLSKQNKDSQENPREYGGSEDGRAAQDLHDSHRLIRALTSQKLKQLDKELKQQESQCSVCRELFVETLAVAGSGASLDLLLEKIQQKEVSDNRTASIFFNLANNVQSPEAVEKMMKFVMSLQEEQRVTVSLLSKINFSLLVRRLCISPLIQSYSHMQYVFGDKMCDRSKIISQYLPHLEQRINSASKTWVKILNVIAVADLGAPEGLQILEKVARGQASQDRFLRYAAIHGMAVDSFDSSSRDQIFNILQPIAESQVEDYRIRQIAYNSLLTWKPNVTFLQRMAANSFNEPSQQMQSFFYWVIDSLARIEDDSFRPLSNAARNLLPVTRYMNPSIHRSMNYISSRYLREELVGSTTHSVWLTGFKQYFPREMYSFVAGKFGRFSIPLLETVTYGNTQTMYSKLRSVMEDITKPRGASVRSHMSRIHQQINSYKMFASGSEAQQPSFYQYTKMFRTSQAFFPLTDELYSQIHSGVGKMLKKLGEKQHVVMHKYMNPVEVNVMLPTPVGLWMHAEVSTPTIMFADVVMEAQASSGSDDPSRLPSLGRLNVSAEGVVKIVSKINSYTYVLAPWSNKTVMVAVDNEKSLSLPMKYQVSADLQMPVRELWAQITPQFQQSSEKVPVIKIRNVPFTAIGKLFPSPEYPQEMQDFQQVQWLYSKDQWSQDRIAISKASTGLNAEIVYRGEPESPFSQSKLYDYLKEPSRLISLLASPSVKNYDLSVYHLPGDSPTKHIGFSIRHIMQPGASSGPQIQVPHSAAQPADVAPEDSLEQRQQKIAQFSNQENNEYSAQVNFTGAQLKKYEVSFIIGQDERNAGRESVKRMFSKVQLSVLEKNQESQRKPRICAVSVIDRPELRPMTTASELLKAHAQESLMAPIAAYLYEGSSCSQSQQPLAQARADLTVSENRIKEIMKVTASGDFAYNSTSEFYRLAVYDQLSLSVDWKSPSDQLKNFTFRAQDLAEGYLFPKIVKNYQAPNEPNKMSVRANRSISDDRVDAWITLPEATCHAERISIQPWFDALTGFTSDVYAANSSESRLKSGSPGSKCFIQPSQVRTFDGFSYVKTPCGCATIASKVKQGDDSLVVLVRQISQSPAEEEVQILSAKEGLEIIIRGQDVKVNGEHMPQSQSSKEVRDAAGNLLATIERTPSSVDVVLPGKLQVFFKDGNQVMIKLDQRYMNSAQGLCGDYNSESEDDLRDPERCVYTTSQGPMFAASWIASESECSEPSMKALFGKVHQYQPNCSKGRRAVSTPRDCQIAVYPITQQSGFICVSESQKELCKPLCTHYIMTHVTLKSKCWSPASAPEILIANAAQGYSTTPVPGTPELTTDAHYYLPLSCMSDCHKQLCAGPDQQCYVQAYPVQRAGPLLCVTEIPMQECKDECSVGDTVPTQMKGKCWNEQDAPQQVRQAVYQGYVTSPVSQPAQFSQQLTVQKPIQCHPPH